MKAIGFVDYENIWEGLHEYGYRLTPEEFIQLLEEYANYIEVDLTAIYLYANFDKEEFWRTQTAFEKESIFTRHVYGKNNYVNTEVRHNAADTEMMLEIQDILLTKPSAADVILLFSGDGDFLPIIRRVRAWGKDIRIIGVKNKIHQLLHPYCESFDVFCTLLKKGSSEYKPSDDLVKGIKLIAEMQIKLPYVASTRARMALSKKLERTTSEIKDYIQYLFTENYLIEKETYDSNLVIKKTKIYLLNLDNIGIKNIVGDLIDQLKVRYSRLDYLTRAEEDQDND
ncbi:MAG: NYN domain-containing protein [Gracilibacter sp. BRH_c7a]|nr:MAG: NYN domain-containing protein [Gracilibacter sp. BRH_c7a]